MTETDVKKEVERIKGRYTVIAAVITTLGVIVSAVIGFYAVVVPLQEKNDTLQQENEALEAESQENQVQGDNPELEATISNLQESFGELETRYATLESENTELKAENTRLKQELATAQATIEEKNERIKELEARIKELEGTSGRTGESEKTKVEDTPTNLQSESLISLGLGYLQNYGTQTDNHGMEHENCISIGPWSGVHYSNYHDWNLDWQYEEISGTFFYSQKYIVAPLNGKLTIYGNKGDGKDDTILWSRQIDKDSEVLSFRVSVRGMETISIYFNTSNRAEDNFIFLSDAYLWK